jgi:hypothetical protein
MPQALTWNIGTTGRIEICEEMLSAAGLQEDMACSTVERWL